MQSRSKRIWMAISQCKYTHSPTVWLHSLLSIPQRPRRPNYRACWHYPPNPSGKATEQLNIYATLIRHIEQLTVAAPLPHIYYVWHNQFAFKNNVILFAMQFFQLEPPSAVCPRHTTYNCGGGSSSDDIHYVYIYIYDPLRLCLSLNRKVETQQ